MHQDADLTRIRNQFPALRPRAGEPVPAFFDGPGGTQVPQPVIDAVADYLAHRNANTHGLFATSRATDETLTHARHCLADFLAAPSPSEIVFGANMTTLTFAVSRALGREWGPGDEIVVTQLDHQANVAPWRLMAEERGLTVHTVPFDPETLTLRLDVLERTLSPRTRLVAVGAASNAVGTVSDVPRIARLAREAGALCYVDAVHYAPHRRVDVEALGCDFLACSAYKFFGPHVGVLWGREELLQRFRPFKVPPASDQVPERWESGTLNHEGIAGAAAAVEWIASLGGTEGDRRTRLRRAWEWIEEHEAALFARLREGLLEIPGARLFGPPAGAPRTPTAAFTLAGHPPEAVAGRLAEEGVNVWAGDFYAPTVIEGIGCHGTGGVVRAGVAVYSSGDDVERLLAGARRIAGA